MSTKTNFKRIALVAVASLGLGLLGTVPANATTSGVAITVTDGTSVRNGKSDSTNAARITITGFVGAGDSLVVTAVQKSVPGTSAGLLPVLYNLDSSTPNISTVVVESSAATAPGANVVTALSNSTMIVAGKRTISGNATGDTAVASFGARISSTADANISRTFGLQLDTSSTTRAAGTYTYTVVLRIYEANATNLATPTTQTITKDVNIVIAPLATEETTVTPGSSSAFIGTATGAGSDAVISALATASTTPAAYVRVTTVNSGGTATAESITATITGAGILSFGGISGSSLTVAGTGSSDISVLPNGVAGTATITISTTTRSFPAKTMTFYAAKPATLVASVATPLAAIGTNSDVVRVTAKDSAGVSWAGALYIYASSATDAAIAGSTTTPVLCKWDAADDRHECEVTGNAAGTAKMKVFNYATAALSAAADAATAGSTVTSNEVSVVVSQASAATVKLEFDKASYAPGERARIYVTPLDSTGKAMQATAFTNLFATGGISTAAALTFAGSTTTADSLTAVAITTKGNSSSTSGAKAGSMEFTVYMPGAGGTVTISATGGASLPIAGRVAVTASATVTDSGAAALAAVNALATTVASLKTLITTLTNLVLKIQKKVKA